MKSLTFYILNVCVCVKMNSVLFLLYTYKTFYMHNMCWLIYICTCIYIALYTNRQIVNRMWNLDKTIRLFRILLLYNMFIGGEAAMDSHVQYVYIHQRQRQDIKIGEYCEQCLYIPHAMRIIIYFYLCLFRASSSYIHIGVMFVLAAFI